MENKDNTQVFSLEDIMREFGTENPEPENNPEEISGMPELSLEDTRVLPEIPGEQNEPQAELSLDETRRIPDLTEEVCLDMEVFDREDPADEEPSAVTDDTIRLDDLSEAVARAREMTRQETEQAETSEDEEEAGEEEEEAPAQEETAETGEESPEAVEETTAAPEPVKQDPIIFRSRLRELKRKLVAGPEKRYYELTEIGVGRVQAAILVSLLVVALCAGATAMYALGMVAQNRLKLMIFSQIFAMMVSALVGCYVLMDGIVDLFTGKFSLNTMLVLTLGACAADSLICLRELRVPCCAAFSLEMTFALWNRSLRRQTEMGQMDTLRKAVNLVGLVKQPDYHEGKAGILRTEGRLEDFMDNYGKRTGPERAQNIFTLVSLLGCIGIAVLAYLRHGVSMAVQILATSMLVAVPAGFFVSQSRPAAILQRRLHMVGSVICGWQGVKTLCGKAMFPLHDRDIFPLGATKLNGVKFLGEREPEEVIAYAAAVIKANGGGLEPVFTQLLKSRSCPNYAVTNLQIHSAGGITALVRNEEVAVGTKEFLESQGIKMPEGTQVPNAVYCAIEKEFSAVFAINYNRTKSAAGGLVSLGGCRKITPVVLSPDFLITAELLRSKFGVKAKRYRFPERKVRDELIRVQPGETLVAGALATQENLSAMSYAVTGARTLRTASRCGTVIHVVAGLVGMLIMAALAYIGSTELLTPVNVLLYQLVWLLPGLLITEWTRTV